MAPLTVCISNFPRYVIDSQILYDKITEVYPGVKKLRKMELKHKARVLDAQIALDARELSLLEEEKKICERELSKQSQIQEILGPQESSICSCFFEF